LQVEFYRFKQVAFSIFTLFLALSVGSTAASAQQLVGKAKSGGARRISFAEAQRLLSGESEGNLSRQSNTSSRTKLRTGQVLELYYPVTTPSRSGKARNATIAGYGLLYESEAAFKDANRPRHVLEDLIPDGENLISQIPQLVARLEKRLQLGAGKLDYSRASLRRLDIYITGFHRSHTTAQTDPKLFQELTAYYGETLRRSINGEWRSRKERVGETYIQVEPNIAFDSGGKTKEIKPWSSVVNVLYDDLYDKDKRGVSLTKAFDADLTAAK
jgi:hypothetical protein